MSDKSKTKVITPPATLSYPHIAEAQPGKKPTDKAKFSATFVFAPGTDLSALEAAVATAAEERYGDKGAEMLRIGDLRSPFRKDAERKHYAAGSVFINTRSDRQPGVVNVWAGTDGKPATIEQKDIVETLYPGALVRASVVAFTYDVDGNKGVSFALNNIQKLGDGARLDNRVAATDEFDADLNAAPADLASLMS